MILLKLLFQWYISRFTGLHQSLQIVVYIKKKRLSDLDNRLTFNLLRVSRLGHEPSVISSSISVLSEISALHPSRFSP